MADALFPPVGSVAAPMAASVIPPRSAVSRAAASRAVAGASRSAHAMARSRTAILDGARQAVAVDGIKITMGQVATTAGVAKATLYNHFRTREDVLGALLIDELQKLVAALSGLGLPEALTTAATAISEHPLLEALGGQDMTTLAALARVDVRTPGWALVADALERLLRQAGRGGTPTVLRWLSSFVIAPADNPDIAADVAVLLAGLPTAR